jgi:hypothetical protein
LSARGGFVLGVKIVKYKFLKYDYRASKAMGIFKAKF